MERYSWNEMIEFRNQPKGMAYQTKAAPKRGARMAAKSTRKVRLATHFQADEGEEEADEMQVLHTGFQGEFRPTRAEK